MVETWQTVISNLPQEEKSVLFHKGSVPVQISSSSLHWTSTVTDQNGYILQSDPKLVQIAVPHHYGSNSSNGIGKPICTHTDMDLFGSFPV